MGSIFISYCHRDADKVLPFCELLRKRNYLCWFDKKNIDDGDFWDEHIKTAIASCRVFIAFLSNEYNNSIYCREEFARAKRNDHCKIFVVTIGNVLNNLNILDEYSAYQVITLEGEGFDQNLLNRLSVRDEFDECRLVATKRKVDIDKCKTFITFLGQNKERNLLNYLKIFLQVLLKINDFNCEGKYLNKQSDFSSLVIDDAFSSNPEAFFINDNDFSNNLEDMCFQNNFIKNVYLNLFTLFQNPFSQNIKLNKICLSNAFADYLEKNYLRRDNFNSKPVSHFIKETFKYFEYEINNLFSADELLDNLIQRVSSIYSAYATFINILKRINLETSFVDSSVSRQCFDVLKIYYKCFYLDKKIISECLPDLKDEGSGKILSENSLGENYFRNGNFYLYGNYGCGASCLLISLFLKSSDILYLDLSKIVEYAECEDNLIKHSFTLTYKNTLGLSYAPLSNYSFYHSRVTLILDNFDYLNSENKKKILKELEDLNDSFNICFYSRKRNIDNKVYLDNQTSNVFQKFSYLEVLPLDSKKILTYLEKCNTDLDLISQLKNNSNQSFFEFFNSFSKLNIFISLNQDNEISDENETLISPIKMYQLFFDSKEDFSLSKNISTLFENDLADIKDIISSAVQDEIRKIEQIAFYGNYNELTKKRFRNLFVKYNVLYEKEGKYYIVDDLKVYFKASYLSHQIKESITNYDFENLEQMLMPFANQYQVLEYLSEMKLFDDDFYFTLSQTQEDKFVHLKEIIYKIALYNDEEEVLRLMSLISLPEISEHAFLNCENLEIVYLPNNLKKIGHAAFANMSRLKKLVLSSLSEELIISAFAAVNCQNLKTIILGDNYKKYHHPLFFNLKNLKKIIVSENNSFFTSLLDDKVLYSFDGKILYIAANSLQGEVILPETTEVITEHSLAYLDKITKLKINKNCISISSDFTDFDMMLTEYEVDSKNPLFFTSSGVLYKKDDKLTLFRLPPGYFGEVKISDDVKVIGGDSLSTCQKVKKIILNRGLEKIGSYAFADIYNLEEVDFTSSDIRKIQLGNYLFLSSNDDVKIIIKSFDEIKSLNLKQFNSVYNQNNIHSIEYRFVKPQKIDIGFLEKNFEIISNPKNEKEYARVVLLRNTKQFRDVISIKDTNYNILLIGLAEYNLINCKSHDEIIKYLDDLIINSHISMMVFLRDLPIIEEFLSFKNQIALLRSERDFLKGSTLLIDMFKEEIK